MYATNTKLDDIINTAMVTLLLKNDAPIDVTDYRLISLIHSFAKLLAKVLSMRLAAHIDHLISPTQTAFMISKCIHKNFLYVRNIVWLLHCRKLVDYQFNTIYCVSGRLAKYTDSWKKLDRGLHN